MLWFFFEINSGRDWMAWMDREEWEGIDGMRREGWDEIGVDG